MRSADRPISWYLRIALVVAVGVFLLVLAITAARSAALRNLSESRTHTEGLLEEGLGLNARGLELMGSPGDAELLATWHDEAARLADQARGMGARHGFNAAELESLAALADRLGRREPGLPDLAAVSGLLVLVSEVNDRMESRSLGAGLLSSLLSLVLFAAIGSGYVLILHKFRRRVGKAIPALRAQLEAVASGDFGAPEVGGSDEFGEVSSEVAKAARRLEATYRELAAERDRSAALHEEGERLFRELAHRVRNNYAVMASLVDLQRREVGSGEAGLALADLGGRIRSIAVLHDHLEGSGEGSVDAAALLSDLLKGIVGSLIEDPSSVEIDVRGDGSRLDPRRAKTVGLIANELATNSLKYAWPALRSEGRRLVLRYAFLARGNAYRFEASDDGPGYPPGAPVLLKRPVGERHGLGLELVRSFCRDLGGEAGFASGPGAAFSVEFPISPG